MVVEFLVLFADNQAVGIQTVDRLTADSPAAGQMPADSQPEQSADNLPDQAVGNPPAQLVGSFAAVLADMLPDQFADSQTESPDNSVE